MVVRLLPRICQILVMVTSAFRVTQILSYVAANELHGAVNKIQVVLN